MFSITKNKRCFNIWLAFKKIPFNVVVNEVNLLTKAYFFNQFKEHDMLWYVMIVLIVKLINCNKSEAVFTLFDIFN